MAVGTVAAVVVESSNIHPWDMFEFGIVNAVFGIPAPELVDPWYDLRWCSIDVPRPDNGFGLTTPYGLDDIAGADTVIVPSVPESWLTRTDDPAPELTAALREAHGRGARMVSLCTGVFALAAAGLLDGKRATGHWWHTDDLKRRFPQVEVDPTVLYVDEGDVLTSAGLTAGMDLCLHLVRSDLGPLAANHLARRLVTPAHRTGGQAQFVDLSVPRSDDASIEPVLQWARENLSEPITVDSLAQRAHLSPRTLFRRVQQATGMAPMQWLLNQRIAFAQLLLETTYLSVERIADRSGMGTGANLRRHFQQVVGVTPTDYRRAFPCPGAAEVDAMPSAG
ncbi:transcriptional regulator GlxA family with amidase domain [Nocardioides thalensis]|uniref:Transcriptional regulator GlxA family with amidase domain n=1 Tax=Nocardioides thalensis TaxID=1914755 RepID=A0A853C7G0_9ACTN|nr:helix-turn-helix domain-containing protein [Nocardioides thalensis]NYJ02946.1 transcriptional regulator GlxA family with amidase domain [Nocardioides thalensis]